MDRQWWALVFLLIIPLFWWWSWRRRRASTSAIAYSDLQIAKIALLQSRRTWLLWVKRHIHPILRSLFVLCAVAALVGPKQDKQKSQSASDGIDVVLTIDTSGSMRALDLEVDGKPTDRLSVVKHVINQFIDNRPTDRMGIVVFGDAAFTQSPITADHAILNQLLDYIQIGMIGEQTAIGDALALSVNRLKDVDAKSKIIILLTDGANTAGSIDPLKAADAAKEYGIRVYTIGVGREGRVPYPSAGWGFGTSIQYIESQIDETLLKDISEKTNGVFYRALDTEGLKNIYDEIAKLETKTVTQRQELPKLLINEQWVIAALLFLLLEVLTALTGWRRIP